MPMKTNQLQSRRKQYVNEIDVPRFSKPLLRTLKCEQQAYDMQELKVFF